MGRRDERGSNRVLRRCGAVVLYALVTACGARTPDRPAPGEVQPAEVAAEPVDCDTYADGALLVRAESREEFVAALGEPDSVTTVTWPNRHDGTITDTIVALHFAELSAVLWRPGHEGAGELLEHVEVRGNRHLRWPTLGIGAAAGEITDALGPPTERSPNRMVYRCGADEAEAEPLVFMLANGTVERVMFNWYVD